MCPITFRKLFQSLAIAFLVGGVVAESLFAEDDEARIDTAEQEHPGFFDQWSEMKSDDEGGIRTGLLANWYRRDREVRTSAPALNVQNPMDVVRFVGPHDVGGRTRAILIDRCNSNRIFAGAISGGLWYSEDRGRSWSATDDSAVSLAVSGIMQSPYDHREIYYCTGEARANSGGISGSGLFKSQDGGRSFVQIGSTANDRYFDRCWCLSHSRSARNTIYVGTEAGGLLRSQDGGNSWIEVLNEGPVTDVICFPNGAVLTSVSGDGIYHSRSGRPGTFVKIESQQFPEEFGRVEIAECTGHPRVVYAAFEKLGKWGGTNGVCVSHDGGCTWNAREVPVTSNTYRRYCFTLAVHPCDPSLIFCAGRFSLFSRDGGHSWRRAHQSHADYHTLATFPDNADQFLVGNDGGVYMYRWSDPRAESTDLNRGYQVTQLYAGDFAATRELMIGGTQDNGTFRIDNGSYQSVAGGDGTYCHLSRQDPALAYFSYQAGVLMRSVDFQSEEPAWDRINDDSEMNAESYKFVNPFQINLSDGRQIYCRTNQAIWRSLDAGASWDRLTSGIIPDLFAIACSDEPDPVLYVGGANSTLVRIDHGATSSPGDEHELSETAPAELENDFLGAITIHPSDNGTIFAGFANFVARPRIWKVTDSDTPSPTWVNISGDLPSLLPVNGIVIDPSDPDRTFFAATDFGLYYTVDGGIHWYKEERIPNVSIHQMRFRPSDRSLHLFTHGRGVWKVELR